MRVSLVAAGIVVGLALAACGEAQEAVQQPANAENPAATEAGLRKRAQAALAELNSGDRMAYYEYLSPRLRKERFPFGLEIAQVCSPDEFLYQMEDQMFALLVMINAEGGELPRWMATGVALEGIIGFVNVEVSYRGQPVELARVQQKERWAFRDGEWWVENEDWRDRCPRLVATQEEVTEEGTTN